MTSFDKEFGGEHLGVGCGAPGGDALAYDAPRVKAVSDKDLADFDKSFPESARLG
jgi:hypothetical protein